MDFHTVKALSGSIGLLFFIALFLGVLWFAFRPGSGRKFRDASRIPFKED